MVIDTLSLSGAGFSITAVNGTLPYTIAPGNFLAFTVQFLAGPPAAYSAGLLVGKRQRSSAGELDGGPARNVFSSLRTGRSEWREFRHGAQRLPASVQFFDIEREHEQQAWLLSRRSP